jgi:hypothetical protein
MISFCTLSCNAKNELTTFIQALVRYNPGVDFEICVAHDDRVDDGSGETIQILQEQYPQLKVVRNSKADSVEYLRTLLHYYDCHNNFPVDFREQLWSNLMAYRWGDLCKPEESYLWIALGYLFNKAASIATGDILMFAPADYIWPIDLVALEQYVIQNRDRNGLFYGKFGGCYSSISNEPPELLKNVRLERTRNYLYYPCRLEDHYLYEEGEVYQLGTDEYPQQFINICKGLKGTDLFADMHHGTHIMTRKVWEVVGGFTEEFYGRAWPDDKMNAHAMKVFWTDASTMPIEFSFSFIGMAEWQTSLDGTQPEDMPVTDLWFGKHPIQGRNYYQTYLHHGYHNKDYSTNINRELDGEFSFRGTRGREAPIVRLVK